GSTMEFDRWKDYFALALLVPKMARERSCAQQPPKPVYVPSRVCPEEQGATESFCHFCKHNGESGRVYTTHTLRDSRGSVICPVLWKYTCPLCGATGDLSHTLRYCPFNDNKSCLYSKSGRNSSGRLLRQ
uniref:Nanos-type domain-containing protein n=1 Tax=Xenopus tropicalis TaxID=8364 RepID=A0A803JBH9_XENTR